MTQEWILAIAELIMLVGIITVVNVKMNKVRKDLKSDFSVKTQILQDELHEIYLRSLRDSNRKRNRRRRIYANNRLNV